MDLGNIIILTGRSRKGKNRVQEWGTKWTVTRMRDTVTFSSNAGPWMLVHSEKDERGADWFMWVNTKDDLNFEVKKD